MLNQTLKDFYYGNLTPENRQMMRGSEIARVSEELSSTEKQLYQQLPQEIRPLLDRLVKAQGNLDSLMAETSYIDGFKTGARFMMEILDDARENLEPLHD